MYAGTNIYRVLGKGDGMIFGNGICWNGHLPYTWFEWLAVAMYIFMSGRGVNIDICHAHQWHSIHFQS